MNSREGALFCLALATEFRDVSEREHARSEWAPRVQQAQLSVENAAKAVRASVGPTPQTHEPRHELAALQARFPNLPADVTAALNVLVDCCRHLGFREHVLSSYGDEHTQRTPSQLDFIHFGVSAVTDFSHFAGNRPGFFEYRLSNSTFKKS